MTTSSPVNTQAGSVTAVYDQVRTTSWGRVALFLAILAPPMGIACLILSYSVNVPYLDDWVNSVLIYHKTLGGTLTLRDLFAPINGHRLPIPRLLTLAADVITGGDRRATMWLSFAVVCATSVNLMALVRRTFPRRALGVMVVINLLLFSPVQIENWLWANQLAMFLANLFLILAIRLTFSGQPSRAWCSAGSHAGSGAAQFFSRAGLRAGHRRRPGVASERIIATPQGSSRLVACSDCRLLALFVGHGFGPEPGVRRIEGWPYRPNPAVSLRIFWRHRFRCSADQSSWSRGLVEQFSPLRQFFSRPFVCRTSIAIVHCLGWH